MVQDFRDINTAHDLWGTVLKRATDLGFGMASLSVVDGTGSDPSDWTVWHNAPEAYQETFFDQSDCRRDPVQQHMRLHSTPLVWDWRAYKSSGADDLYEAQRSFGIVSGIAVTVHKSATEHVILGLDVPREADRAFGRHLPWVVAEVVALAHNSATPALRLVKQRASSHGLEALTTTEQVVLALWRDLGNIDAVSRGMGITRRAVLAHITSAAQKLSVATDDVLQFPLSWGDAFH